MNSLILILLLAAPAASPKPTPESHTFVKMPAPCVAAYEESFGEKPPKNLQAFPVPEARRKALLESKDLLDIFYPYERVMLQEETPEDRNAVLTWMLTETGDFPRARFPRQNMEWAAEDVQYARRALCQKLMSR